jgi:predicted small secreted protein
VSHKVKTFWKSMEDEARFLWALREAGVIETDLVYCIRLIIVFFFYNYVCECTVGVDVGDGTTILRSILSNIVMGCIVLGRQMNVDFTTTGCTNAMTFVGMDVRFCTMKIHDSATICPQTIPSIVVSPGNRLILVLYWHQHSTPHDQCSP